MKSRAPLAVLALLIPLVAASLRQEEAVRPEAHAPGAQKIRTFLMFEGRAEEAMELYTSLFDDAEVKTIERYGPGGPGEEGSVVSAVFTLAGQEFQCIDSAVGHDFGFTPAISLFVTCASEEEIDRLTEVLSEEGEVFMPLGPYPFARRFVWLADRFGVSWQLSLPHE